ncbi:hypothetical protein BKA69DRAFT_1127055 [Paraphysoderma sedebokerense]|nr:hypothetical protein BKA69DRAFT_1127055 [Paraphysoderma sedebokerense]
MKLSIPRRQIIPKLLLAGHNTPVSAICITTVDSELTSEGIDTVLVTGSEDGELIMWNLIDGQSLQINSSGFSGAITSMQPSPTGNYILVSGCLNEIRIIEAKSLEVVKTKQDIADWVPSMIFVETGVSKQPHVITLSNSGFISLHTFNEETIELSDPIHTIPLSKDLSLQRPGFFFSLKYHNSLTRGKESKDAGMAIGRKKVVMFRIEASQLVIICAIGGPPSPGSWAGGEFISDDAVLLWTVFGRAHYYLIDREKKISALKSSFDHKKDGSYQAITCLLPTISGDKCFHALAFRNTPESTNFVVYTVNDNIIRTHMDKAATLPCSADFCFREIWPLYRKRVAGAPTVTAIALVNGRVAAEGFDNGEIRLLPLSKVFSGHQLTAESTNGPSGRPSSIIYPVLKGHNGRVSCLFIPEYKNYLISGGNDSTIKFWNTKSGELLARFTQHTTEITTFVQPPAEAGFRMKNCVLSISKDNSISVLSLEEMSCLYFFTGHAYPVTQVIWKAAEDYLMIATADGSVHVWQLQTAHLDRIESGRTAIDILATAGDCRVNVSSRCDHRNMNFKNMVTCFPVTSEGAFEEYPSLHVLMSNVKRLVMDVFQLTHEKDRPKGGHSRQGSLATSGAGLSTPEGAKDRRRGHQRNGSIESPLKFQSNPTNPTNSSSSRSKLSQRPALSAIFSSPDINPSPSSTQNSPTKNVVSPAHNSQVKNVPSSPLSPHSRAATSDSTSTLLVSAVQDRLENPDGQKEDIEGTKTTDLQIEQSLFSAFMTWSIDPMIDQIAKEKFGVMEHLSNVTVGLRGVGGNISILAPTYDTGVTSWCISPTMTAARLLAIITLTKSLLAFQGTEEDASLIITRYMTTIPEIVGSEYCYSSLSYLARYWQDTSVDLQHAARCLFVATLSRLSSEKKKEVVEYWYRYLPSVAPSKDGFTKTMARATIILGVLGSEYPDVLSLRTAKEIALSLTLLLNEDNPNKTMYRLASCELIGKGFTTWEPHVNGAAVLRTLIAFTGTHVQVPGLIGMARQAIFHIATTNPALFSSTVTFDLVHSKSIPERIGLLRLLSLMVQKNSQIVNIFVSRIVESIVKVLDPNAPSVREALLQATTAVLYDLVRTYSFVAFHGGSQRLGVGTAEGSIIIYDLKTATKWQVLEGHTKSVTAISFSADAKLIVSYSMDESTLKFWQPATGFLNMLATTLGSGGSGGGGSALKSFKSFVVKFPEQKANVNPGTAGIKFEWVAERMVKLVDGNGAVLSFTV